MCTKLCTMLTAYYKIPKLVWVIIVALIHRKGRNIIQRIPLPIQWMLNSANIICWTCCWFLDVGWRIMMSQYHVELRTWQHVSYNWTNSFHHWNQISLVILVRSINDTSFQICECEQVKKRIFDLVLIQTALKCCYHVRHLPTIICSSILGWTILLILWSCNLSCSMQLRVLQLRSTWHYSSPFLCSNHCIKCVLQNTPE